MKLNKLIIVLSSLLFLGIPVFANIANDAKLEYNKGIDYYQLGQYNMAIDSFKKATELDPNYIDAYFNLGSLLEYLNQNEEALNAFKQIILRKPDDYESVYKAAELSKKIGNPDKAKMYLSLIPVDSLIGQRANKLASTLQTDLPTIQAEQKKPKSFAEANPKDDSNGLYSDISSPTGIVTDNNGNIYVAGFSDNTIYKIGPDNKKIVYIKDKKIDGPIGIAIDEDGNIYIANYNKNNVLKVDTGGIVSELISNVKNPYCMHINGNLLFISSQGSDSVVRYKLR
ncbi:tetratricopeptide repeat protein [bacterium]|nr:tetratricopeptide repeat protein [bacterium]